MQTGLVAKSVVRFAMKFSGKGLQSASYGHGGEYAAHLYFFRLDHRPLFARGQSHEPDSYSPLRPFSNSPEFGR